MAGENWFSEETAKRSGFDGTGGIIEGIDDAGAEETSDGGDEGGGRHSVDGIVREGGVEVGDVTKEEAIDGARGSGEALDHRG